MVSNIATTPPPGDHSLLANVLFYGGSLEFVAAFAVQMIYVVRVLSIIHATNRTNELFGHDLRLSETPLGRLINWGSRAAMVMGGLGVMASLHIDAPHPAPSP